MMKRTLSRIGILLLTVVFLTVAAAACAESVSPVLRAEDLFTERDFVHEPDLTGAVSCTVADGQDIEITEAGVYVLTGSASGVTVTVNAPDNAKVQIVLNGVSIVNEDYPCIYVKSADKVFITTAADSSLSVTGVFRMDGNKKTNGVILSRSDLVLNGTALLTVDSSKHGIVGKDDLKITGGSYAVTAASKCVDANDSIRIADGTLMLTAGTDGLHAENSDDEAKGYIYIGGGVITILAGDEGIQASSLLQIDGGELNITAKTRMKAVYAQINGGSINSAVPAE